MAFGVNLGTPGVGVQLQAKMNEAIVLRGAVDGIDLSHNEDYGDVRYDGKAKELTAGLFADLHPGGGAFFVSGGAYFGRRRLDMTSQPMAPVEIGDVTYTPAQVGRIDGQAKLSDVQPFLGLGFDNTFSGERKWGFRALLGVAFSDEPKVRLSASGGTLNADPSFQAELRKEEAQVREDAKDFRYFPVIQVGVSRRF